MLAVSFLSICWPLLPWQGECLGRWGPQLVPNWRTLMAWAVRTHLWRLRWKEWLAPTPGIHVAGALPPESAHSWRKKLLRQSHRPPYGLPTMGPRLIGAQASSLLPELPWLWGTTLVSPQAVSRQLISVHSPSWLLKPKSQQLALTHPAEEYLRLGSLAAMTTTCAGLSPTDPPETSGCVLLWGFKAPALSWLISLPIMGLPSVWKPLLFHSSLQGHRFHLHSFLSLSFSFLLCPTQIMSFSHSSVGKESAYSVGDPGSIPELGRSPGEGNGNPLQYSYLENPMDRGTWQATVHAVARVGDDLATKPPPPPRYIEIFLSFFHFEVFLQRSVVFCKKCSTCRCILMNLWEKVRICPNPPPSGSTPWEMHCWVLFFNFFSHSKYFDWRILSIYIESNYWLERTYYPRCVNGFLLLSRSSVPCFLSCYLFCVCFSVFWFQYALNSFRVLLCNNYRASSSSYCEDNIKYFMLETSYFKLITIQL